MEILAVLNIRQIAADLEWCLQQSLLGKLPEDCTLEDVQYHLYVAKKIQRGISRTKSEETLSQDDVERKFSKWTVQ
jgi:hypothetical protein